MGPETINKPTGGTPPVQGEDANEITITMDQLLDAMAKAGTAVIAKNPCLFPFLDDLTTMTALIACILFDEEKED